MFYYLMQDEKIVLADTNRERLEGSIIAFMPQYKGLKILETEKEIVKLKNGFFFKEDVQEELDAKEAERIAQLNMTRGDFFEGLILALGKDEDDVLALIDVLDLTDIEKKVFKSRVKNALDFYRGYPLIDKMCEYLSLSTEQMTQFFETKDYTALLPVEPPVEKETEGEVINENTDN